MKGRNEITDDAALALVRAYCKYNLQLAPVEERLQQCDGWKRVRETWNLLTEELNNEFNITIKTEQWKKKISNIKTNVKTKRNLERSGVLASKITWSLAELEYVLLFKPKPMPLSVGKIMNRRDRVNSSSSPDTVNNNDCGEATHLPTDFFHSKIENQIFSNEMTSADFSNATDDEKCRSRATKRKHALIVEEDVANRANTKPITANTSVASFLLANSTSSLVAPTTEIESHNLTLLLTELQQQQLTVNYRPIQHQPFSVLYKKNLSADNENHRSANAIQLKAAQTQLEAAKIQKSASEKLLLTVERLASTVTKFERFVNRLHFSVSKPLLPTVMFSEDNFVRT